MYAPENVSAALRLLHAATPYLDIFAVAGDRNRKLRQAILSRLTEEKVLAAKAGIGALETAFHAALGIEGDCIATRERAFVAAAKVLLAKMGETKNIPPCAASMGCLCAGHAKGNAATEPCDTSE